MNLKDQTLGVTNRSDFSGLEFTYNTKSKFKEIDLISHAIYRIA